MKKVNYFIAAVIVGVIAAFSSNASYAQEGTPDYVRPDETYMFAERDSIPLYMDIYYPADGSVMSVDGVDKPTILYVFGGGFKGGRRDSRGVQRWFKLLADEGFTIVAIDYRLGLKDVEKMGVAQAGLLYKAIEMAVEDAFAATDFILANSEMLEIDPSNIIISGSSAGAITALQAEWEICNRTDLGRMLPEDFNYAGVMAFSGAVFSKKWGVNYKKEPAPTIMFHGTADKIVTYKQIKVLNQAFEGTARLARTFKRNDYDYNIYRYVGNGHEIAGAMIQTFPEQLRWLEANIIGKEKRTVDVRVSDPSIPKWNLSNLKDIYNGSVNLE